MKKEELIEVYKKQYNAKVKIVSKNAKKKRVLYSLLVILVLTICYEYYNDIKSFFTGKEETVKVETVTSEVKNETGKLNKESFKRLIQPFLKISKNNPQLEMNSDTLFNSLNTLMMAIHDDSSENNTEKGKEVLDSLYQYSIHPFVIQNKEVKEFQKLIKAAAKQNNIIINEEFAIKPLIYSKENVKAEPGKRNLFEYGEIDEE